MANIRLDESETALWKETGTRGEAFRRATRGRACEQVRETGRLSEILDWEGKMVGAEEPGHPEPNQNRT